jgi:hypothetical protein
MREHPLKSSFQNFFSIDVFDENFPDGSMANVEIIPSADTMFLFRGMNVHWQHLGHRFLAQLHTTVTEQNQVQPPKEQQWRTIYGHQVLRFYIRVREEGLYGHRDARPSPGRKFYFSNLPGTPESGGLFPGTSLPCIPQMEEITYSTGSCSFVFAPGSGITRTDIKFYAFNYDAAAPGFTLPAGMPANLEFATPREKIDVALFSLHPGKYRVGMNGLTKDIYYDPVLAREDIAGVLELYFHLPAAHVNALLEDNGMIREQQFILFFPGKFVQDRQYLVLDTETVPAGKDICLPAVHESVRVLEKFWTRKDKTG